MLGSNVESGRLFFCTQQGGFTPVEIRMDATVRQRLGQVLSLITQSFDFGAQESVWDGYGLTTSIRLPKGGTVQGGVQSLSRSLFSQLIPRERSGEYFGFYNMLGKFAAVVGPVLVGVMAAVSGSSRIGVSSLMVLFAAGGLLLWRVRVPERSR